MNLFNSAYTKSSSVRAVITRADGTTEDLGLIAYHHRNPAISWAVNFYIKLKGLL